MILTKIKKNNEDGSYDTIWKLSEEQVQVLISLAVQILVAQGLAKVVEEVADNEEISIDPSILARLNKDDLPRA